MLIVADQSFANRIQTTYFCLLTATVRSTTTQEFIIFVYKSSFTEKMHHPRLVVKEPQDLLFYAIENDEN